MTVRTRFAPSPTGYLHIGGIRTALFSWLFVKHHAGDFILRIEDTDKERSTEEAVQVILDSMQWLELDFNGKPYFQSEHFERYKEVIQQLLSEDKAYYCCCSKEELETMRNDAMTKGEKPKYNRKCRHRTDVPDEKGSQVVRFKNPTTGEVVVDDLIQGSVRYQNAELDDLIIARSDGTPTYNLTVVVDDLDMEISHVIRGDDHLNNTPRQMNIFSALDVAAPRYAHVPMILGPDGKKLSKRHGTVSVLQYREDGYLRDAFLNYLVRLGWSHGDKEIFSEKEMIELFDIKDVNKAASAINPEKLLWLNSEYIKASGITKLAVLLKDQLEKLNIDSSDGPGLEELVIVQRERCKDLVEMVEQSRCFFEDFDSFDEAAAKKHLRPVILEALTNLRECLSILNSWSNEEIYGAVTAAAEEFGLKMGKIAQPLRVAVTGVGVSPPIDDTLRLVGKERTLKRLDLALKYIQLRAST